MPDFVNTYPTARKRHRCSLCGWAIWTGERYLRGAGFDAGAVWTWKECLWCERTAAQYGRERFDLYDEGYDRCTIADWLNDNHPDVWAQMRAGWTYPDGERVPLPFQSRCSACGTLTRSMALWCPTCDDARLGKLGEQFRSIAEALGVES